jgi:hypothetical protein
VLRTVSPLDSRLRGNDNRKFFVKQNDGSLTVSPLNSIYKVFDCRGVGQGGAPAQSRAFQR